MRPMDHGNEEDAFLYVVHLQPRRAWLTPSHIKHKERGMRSFVIYMGVWVKREMVVFARQKHSGREK